MVASGVITATPSATAESPLIHRLFAAQTGEQLRL
jgi:hypothetical protein